MQVTPAIHALRLPFRVPVAPGIALDRFVYSYLVYGETVTLIDTGVAGCENTIFDYILSTGRDPSEIALIILTHSHPDHIGAARAIRQATGCRIGAHPAERAWIEDVELQNRERPVPGFSALVGGSVQLDHELVDGDSIEPDDCRTCDMQVFHTPGHSAGSISLFLHSEGALFSGDVIPVTGDLPVYDDALASVQSVRRLRGLPGIQILLSAWDEPRKGEEVYRQMNQALEYLQTIHEAVLSSAGDNSLDPMKLHQKNRRSHRPAPADSESPARPHFCGKPPGPGPEEPAGRRLTRTLRESSGYYFYSSSRIFTSHTSNSW
ncbi:MAG: MBL fold metallo-hydrolase [Methanoregula sp.]|jgi:glyoxylase-like metal-dependent hydrolase (beta-lactamase superfamily II)|uniref:MBL fold metallo-hydrolase n=1 Tax=Methanoregula sp. TaxID=2052170 RepID=UPI003D12B3DE